MFHLLTTSLLNQKLTSYMEGLTAKVFRTFNASVTLERQLRPTYPEGTSVEEMVLQYNDANREVAILCNHQRSLPKNWDENLGKKKKQVEQVQRQVEELEEMLRRVRAGEKVKLMPEKYQGAAAEAGDPRGHGAGGGGAAQTAVSRGAGGAGAVLAHVQVAAVGGAGGEAAGDLPRTTGDDDHQAEGPGQQQARGAGNQ